MTRILVLLPLLLVTSACSRSDHNPMTPSPATSTFGAQVVATCGRLPNTVTTVAVSIDGRPVGTAIPGGPAVTALVTLGSHSIAGRAQNGVSWDDNRTLTASQPDFIVTFACF